MKQEELATINHLVGSVSEEQLRYVDCYVGYYLGVFMPVAGPCFLAITPEHTHPTYMFVLMFDDENKFVIDGHVCQLNQGSCLF